MKIFGRNDDEKSATPADASPAPDTGAPEKKGLFARLFRSGKDSAEPESVPAAEAAAETPAEPAPVAVVAPVAEPAPLPAAVEESVAEAAPVTDPAVNDDGEETAEKKGFFARLRGDTASTGETQQKPGWFARLKQGLSRTSTAFTEGVGNLFLGRKQIDDELMEELETQLVMADVGIAATTEIITNLTKRVARKQLADAPALYTALQGELRTLLEPSNQPLVLDTTRKPYVILVVGVNGVGKTTTIGKLAKRYQRDGLSVMLAAGDTFRAAAVEQLQVWGERNQVPVIAQHTGADSASVLYDALQAAQSRGTDVLIADTAGRLHNKSNLMEELKKVVRVMKKLDDSAPHEVMLVLDAGTGQNALQQARTFQEAVGVSGITITKLDGTAKGGMVFAVSKQLGLPIRFIGVGETIDDLRPFDADEFIQALFNREESAA